VQRLAHLPLTLTRGEQYAAVESFRLLGELSDLQEWIRSTQPHPQLPEIQFLAPKDWVDAANALGDSREDADFARGWRKVRDAAVTRFAPILQEAIEAYARKFDGKFPEDPGELATFIPGMSEASLHSRYRIAEGLDGSIQSVDRVFDLNGSDAETEIKVSAASAWASIGNLPSTPTPTQQ
jgi:hypothetical protein